MISTLQKRFENALNHALSVSCLSPRLVDAMRYSALAPGKRLRPLLVYGACQCVQGDLTFADTAACAVEIIHSFSLIHDDLPCLDNDDYRRGQPTNHKVYGEAMALLAGDGLLNFAFELLTELPATQAINMVKSLSAATGAQGMIAGQALDIEATGKALSIDALEQIHHLKTGKLIIASLQLGAYCHPSPKQEWLNHLTTFGQALGLAFQIQDDLLDLTGTLEELGKQPGQDAKLGKNTYPSLLGIEGAQTYLAETLKAAKAHLDSLPNSDLLQEVFRAITHRKQ